MKSLAIAAIVLAACGRHPEPEAGGRVGIHGMVLFGKTHHYLEHIPMFSPPHDAQILMRVTLRDDKGAVITDDFSTGPFTVEPTAKWSLDDLIAKRLTTFAGNVHRGGFEQNGPLLRAGVRVTIDDVIISRPLPGSEPIAAGNQEYFVVGEPGDLYLSNVIRTERGFQQLLHVDAAPGAGKRITVPSADRLRTGRELWCVTAPDFMNPCN